MTVKPALQIGPMPSRVCVKPGMTWPVLGNALGRLGIRWSAVPLEACTCLEAVPTEMEGAVGSKLVTGASLSKNNPNALVSAMAVGDWLGAGRAGVGAANALVGLNQGELESDKIVLSLSYFSLFSVAAPHRHMHNVHPAGHLSAL